MSKIVVRDVASFESYLERRPQRLGCWRGPTADVLPTLAWLNTRPVLERKELTSKIGVLAAGAMLNSGHHNQSGIASAWTLRHMRGTRAAGTTPEQDRDALWAAAGQYWGLRNALVEIRAGVREFRLEQGVVVMPFVGNRLIDGLDRMLDMASMLGSQPQGPSTPNRRLAEWMRAHGRNTPWQQTPDWVRDIFQRLAIETIADTPCYLPREARLAGFSMAELHAYWRVLMSRGMQMQTAVFFGSADYSTMLPVVPRDRFVTEVSEEAAISLEAANSITRLLTLDTERCPDPALTPLVPFGSGVIPMSSLIVPTSPERNAIAAAQSDPNLVGEAGRLLGKAGEASVLEVLGRLADDTLLTTRVKATRGNGSSAGDLDVVACSPREHLLAIFEIKWHIAADGNAEVYKLERAALDKRKQVARLRGELARQEATVTWPAGWPDVSGFEWRWFVLTNDVLPSRDIDSDGVVLRSHQLLKYMLRKDSSVTALVDLLDHPPAPPAVVQETEWRRARYGDLRLNIETVVG